MPKLNVEIKEASDKVMSYRWVIVGAGILLLFVLSFMIGVRYSCRGGYLDGNTCVEPRYIDLVQLCEYNQVGCFAYCEDAIVRDKEAFYAEYGTKMLT